MHYLMMLLKSKAHKHNCACRLNIEQFRMFLIIYVSLLERNKLRDKRIFMPKMSVTLERQVEVVKLSHHTLMMILLYLCLLLLLFATSHTCTCHNIKLINHYRQQIKKV